MVTRFIIINLNQNSNPLATNKIFISETFLRVIENAFIIKIFASSHNILSSEKNINIRS